ncbi:hypothetical protein SMACR_09587 [Sordaria macrospora]|uniref:Uncharacterized protein n=1 Tax=Sordaria macrospora TaxID=5147 RepID=A0A8S8ZJV2_SORMA|nr:hypothetical protein SMACR_09587 [Sordaria macrospora]
MLRLSRSAIT